MLGKHLGDFAAGTVLDFKFNTIRPSTSAPFTLAGSPALAAYKDNSVSQGTTGLTLTVDFDAVTGYHNVRVDTSADGTFFSAGSCFSIMLSAGTVDGVSAAGLEVASFTLGKANVASLSAGAITSTAIATNAIDADALAADAVTEIQSGLATSAALAIVAGYIDTEIADIQSRLPAALVSGRIDASVGAMAANTVTASALAADATAEITTAVLTTQMTESYAANGVAPTLAQAVFALHQWAFDFSISGTAYAVEQLGGSAAFTITLNDATNPTAAHRA